MERWKSLVAVLLLVVQARANPWVFGEDHPNFRVIYHISAHILPFHYNTRQIITIPPCMSLKYVWVKVSNGFGFTPTVQFHKTINVVSIVYGLLQHTGSDYSIVVRGFRTPNCTPGVQQNENGFFPFKLKGQQSKNPRTKSKKMKSGKKNEPQRKGHDFKEASDAVDWKTSGAYDDFKEKKYGYGNDSEDKYDSIKDSREDMSKELKEVGNGGKPNYMVFIIPGKKAGLQGTGDNGGDLGLGRGSYKGDYGDDHGLDYGNVKDYSHKGSKYIGVSEYSGGKRHAKSGAYDRGRGNSKGVYGGSDDNRHSKKEPHSDGSDFKSDDRNYSTSGYIGSNIHVKDKTSLGSVKGYRGSSFNENDQGGSYDGVNESYRHTNNKNSVANSKVNGYRGSSDEEHYKGDSYDDHNESNRHTNSKNRVVNVKGSGHRGSSDEEKYKGESYDDDNKSKRHTTNINSVGNVTGSGHKGSSDEENYDSDLYYGDFRYAGGSGQDKNEGYSGSRLDDEYLDGFGNGNKNQPDDKGKDILSMFCSDYLRANNGREGKILSVDKKVFDYCLFQVGRSN